MAAGRSRFAGREPFTRTIDAAKKYVVSTTLSRVDWNAELVRGELGEAVQRLKQESGKGLLVGGVKLPLALAELGLIDEYELVVQPILAGHGPTLFAGLSKPIVLKLVSRVEFGSGAMAVRHVPRRQAGSGSSTPRWSRKQRQRPSVRWFSACNHLDPDRIIRLEITTCKKRFLDVLTAVREAVYGSTR